MDGKQGGNPEKQAAALVQLAALDEPPLRFAASADAEQTFEAQAKSPLDQTPPPTGLCRPRSPTATPERVLSIRP